MNNSKLGLANTPFDSNAYAAQIFEIDLPSQPDTKRRIQWMVDEITRLEALESDPHLFEKCKILIDFLALPSLIATIEPPWRGLT